MCVNTTTATVSAWPPAASDNCHQYFTQTMTAGRDLMQLKKNPNFLALAHHNSIATIFQSKRWDPEGKFLTLIWLIAVCMVACLGGAIRNKKAFHSNQIDFGNRCAVTFSFTPTGAFYWFNFMGVIVLWCLTLLNLQERQHTGLQTLAQHLFLINVELCITDWSIPLLGRTFRTFSLVIHPKLKLSARVILFIPFNSLFLVKISFLTESCIKI